MHLIKADIEGVLVGRSSRYGDRRGWLTELFRVDELPGTFRPVMGYISMTKPGTVRGPHEHKEQIDCLIFPGMGIFEIYLWDNRRDSATFGRHFRLNSNESETLMVIIPPGVVHGYKNVGLNEGFMVNAPNRLYGGHARGEAVDEIRYEEIPDSHFKIP